MGATVECLDSHRVIIRSGQEPAGYPGGRGREWQVGGWKSLMAASIVMETSAMVMDGSFDMGGRRMTENGDRAIRTPGRREPKPSCSRQQPVRCPRLPLQKPRTAHLASSVMRVTSGFSYFFFFCSFSMITHLAQRRTASTAAIVFISLMKDSKSVSALSSATSYSAVIRFFMESRS